MERQGSPVLLDLLCSIPAVVLVAAAVPIALTVASNQLIYMRRRFSSQDFVAHNEVCGITIAVAGTLYAVILGFLTVVAWHPFQEARERVVLESGAEIGGRRAASALPCDDLNSSNRLSGDGALNYGSEKSLETVYDVKIFRMI